MVFDILRHVALFNNIKSTLDNTSIIGPLSDMMAWRENTQQARGLSHIFLCSGQLAFWHSLEIYVMQY
jgi:hypothetical protein